MLQRQTAPNGVVYYASPLLNATGVPHAFTTRLGGVSAGPFDSLNFGNPANAPAPDPSSAIDENVRRLKSAIGCDDHRFTWVRQVHGCGVARVTGGFESGVDGDALVTRDPRVLLSIRVADCVPILLATDDGSAVAAVHAGWRGIVAGVLPAAVHTLCADTGATPMHLVAAIGPCIGRDAFEVGGEVLAAFRDHFGREAPLIERPDGKGHVDLREAARRQLQRAGLRDDRIDTTDRCTVRDRAEFFSHRRDDGITGRMVAVIAPAQR